MLRAGMLWASLLATILLTIHASVGMAAETYRLGVGDILQVSIFGEPELGGKFTLAADGSIGFPRLGRVMMLNLTQEQAAERLTTGLAGRVPADHTVSLEIIGHAPVFVTGDVQSPGRYEFRPGMIVLELVALGGGLRRPQAPVTGAALQLLTLRQSFADEKLSRLSQRVERARLQAEIAGDEFDATGLTASGAPVDMVTAEMALFQVRKTSLAAQIAAFEAQRHALEDEIAALQESLTLHDRELESIAKDVEATQQLADQGLTALSRLRENQRQYSALKRDKLDVLSFLARARHGSLEVDQRIAALKEGRAAENAMALRLIELAAARSEQKIASLAASIGAASDDLESGGVKALPDATFAVVRRTATGTETIIVTDRDRLIPGDILEVDRHLSDLDSPRALRTGGP
ncbi:exopolysaccharide biosynthesis protein [Kaistia sp. 32K]|uniref:polysaccharide biosynthesis/export family protein n=1 Tax=Kaistia sp. 32K TaxID=2795690 RepID=UPI001915F7B8|nr:polysaccharide biosynthesis/export family protein [Kaistia sp. 32K]BCP53478.1 exopolysaccharide biosynthesis protein [Kaistia sp. 32K]